MPFKTETGDLIRCPLSGSPELEMLDAIDTLDLIRLYYSAFKIDISDLISGIGKIYQFRSHVSDLIFFYPSVTGSRAFYDSLSAMPWYYDENREEFDYVAAQITPDQRLIEVGCGFGHFARRARAADYTGLEFNPRALAAGLAAGLDIRGVPVEEEAARNPQSRDVLCSFQVLEHIAAPEAFIDACIRLVRPGGRIFFSVPSADSFLRHSVNGVLNLPPHHVSWWSDRCLTWLTERFPLRLISLHHFGLGNGTHRRLYIRTMALLALYHHRLKRSPRLVEISDACLALEQEANNTALLLEPGLASPAMEPNGHTVIACYEVGDNG